MINHHIFENGDQVVASIAKEFKQLSEQSKPVHISLSGGSTPKKLFEFLAHSNYAKDINWQQLHFWWGDERCVAPTDEESNYGQAKTLLFDHIDIPPQNIHRILGENDPTQECERFAKEMLETIPCQNTTPVFDWILLGVGDDGHTASLFPHQTNYEDDALTLVAAHPQSKQLRVSKSAKLLQAAKRITFLVLGEGKAEIVEEIHHHLANELPYPAAKIKAKNGTTEWYLDSLAAKKIA